jgi:hypothetical protein
MRKKIGFTVLSRVAFVAGLLACAFSIAASADPSASSADRPTLREQGSSQRPPVDYNGDGKSDWTVVRNQGGIYNWYRFNNGGSPQAAVPWGVNGDRILGGDFDGDNLDDIAVFRPSNATFYILESQSSTIRIDNFGQDGDDPTVVGDYTGDGKDDVAVFRAGSPGIWYYRLPSGSYNAVIWGGDTDYPAPGDYDGDGRNDFAVQRPQAEGGVFYVSTSGGSIYSQQFGAANDWVVPGDYDGDGKTDFAVAHNQAGTFIWSYMPSGGGSPVSRAWGFTSDYTSQGDYDGDGRTDFCVWRPSTGEFYVSTATGGIMSQTWGVTGDIPSARYNTH